MEVLKKHLNLLLEIENTTGAGSQNIIKKLILENYDEDLAYTMQVMFNPFIKTHLNKLGDTTDILYMEDNFDHFKKLISKLSSVKACTNELRHQTTIWVNSFDDDLKRILTMIMTKNVNIGIGAKLVNSALFKKLGKELIPMPSAMLADKGIEKIEKWECKEFRINTKYDGVRIISKWDSVNKWSFFTRNFNELDSNKMTNIIENLNVLCKDLINLGESFFLDGELESLGGKSSDKNSSGARQSITGDVNRILKGNAQDNIDKNFDYVVFDIENSNVLEGTLGTKKYTERRSIVENLFKDLELSNVSLAKEWIISNDEIGREEIRKIYDIHIKAGEEGLIIKHPNSLYECKRSKSWIKMKEILSADLKVIELIEGTGKIAGTLGAIKCEFSTGETVFVGSGFTENLRNYYWNNPENILNKIVEIEYNAKTTDKQGKKSLFLPIFKVVRIDKTEAECY